MTKTSSNKSAVRALVADAEPVASVHRFVGDPEPGKPRGTIKPGQWHPDPLGLPPDCPVVPLGVDGGDNWFLDPIGQLHAYTKPYGQADTIELFRGRHLFLYWAWPKFSVKRTDAGVVIAVDSWRNEKAREALIAAATAKGPWAAVDKVRGRGVWSGPGGELVIHCGGGLLLSRANRNVGAAAGEGFAGGKAEPSRMAETPPGLIEGFVYPTRPPLPRPWPEPLEEQENPARLLKPLLRSWSWVRPSIDPHLALGWLGVAYLGGALAWRSNIFVTGDAGMGKSTLLALFKGVLGDWLTTTTNTTAAGIYQHVRQDCTPVWVDEFEGRSDNSRAVALLELARQASSGGRGLRGGDRGTGSEFTIASAFAFSSINAPPMRPQDLSRFALLQLRQLPPGQAPPDIEPGALGVIGRCILRRVVGQWPRYRETLDAFRAELGRAGMDARGQDTFGTLLACADLIEHDGWDEARLRAPGPDGDLVPWAELMSVSGMIEFEDRTENWRGCLNHLLSVPVDAWRNGTRSTVGQAIEAWCKGTDFDNDLLKVRAVLNQAGLSLRREARQRDWLVVPNQNPLTRRLFEGSVWAGDVGASVWAAALRQGPGAIVRGGGQCTVNGVKSKCALISLQALYGAGGIMTDDDASPVDAAFPDP